MDRLYFVNSIGICFILDAGYSVYLVAAFSVLHTYSVNVNRDRLSIIEPRRSL
jgi:hypothetical protein